MLPFVGSAFVASVAYVDPGNFATNVAAGSQFGHMLLAGQVVMQGLIDRQIPLALRRGITMATVVIALIVVLNAFLLSQILL